MNKENIIIIVIILMIVSLFIFSGGTSDSKIRKNLQKQKEKAMHPRAERSLLRTEPRQGDLILGKQGEKYVCWDTQKDAHCLVIGGSGSGKSSSLVLPFLLNNPDTPVLAVDIKGELVKKGRYMDDPRICIFSPQNHNNYGFDVFYGLNENSSQQEILETMQIVTFSLIPLGNTKDSYWAISARNMLTGLLIYYYNTGHHNIISIIDCILGSPINDQVEEVMNTAEPTANEYKYLTQFSGMADETIMSVYSNMAICLSSFSDLNIRWAFGDAEKKVSPLTLEEKKSIFLCIPEHKLTAWSGQLALIINLTLDALSKRPENSHKILIVLDELGRIVSSGTAGLDGLIDASMTLRSRKVTLFLVIQQIESLYTGFSEHKVTTLIGNCSIKIVLDASSSKTQRTVCSEWVPKYIQRRQSKSSGGRSNSNNYSFAEQDTLTPADLMSLVKNNEEVVITPLGYMMLKKCPYYRDKYLKPKAEKIKNQNERNQKL